MGRRPYQYHRVWLWHGTGRLPGRPGFTVAWSERVGGKWRVRKRTYPDFPTAEQARLEIERNLNRWLPGAPGHELWEVAVGEYARALVTRSQGHQRQAGTVLRQFAEYAKPVTLGDVTPHNLQGYLNSRVNHIMEETRLKEYRYLRGFFSWCRKHGYIDRNPVDPVTRPRPPRRLKVVPTERHWLKLLCAVPRVPLDDAQGWHLLIALAGTTGVRVTALTRLRRGDFDPPTRRTEGVGFIRCISKGDRETLHGLPPEIAERVQRRLHDLPADQDGLFFWSRFPRKAWDRIKQRAGFSFSFHALRALAGTRAAVRAAFEAGAGVLDHSHSQVFAQHYADLQRIQLTAAQRLQLLRLPDMPAFHLRTVPTGPPPRAGNAPPARNDSTASPDGAGDTTSPGSTA